MPMRVLSASVFFCSLRRGNGRKNGRAKTPGHFLNTQIDRPSFNGRAFRYPLFLREAESAYCLIKRSLVQSP